MTGLHNNPISAAEQTLRGGAGKRVGKLADRCILGLVISVGLMAVYVANKVSEVATELGSIKNNFVTDFAKFVATGLVPEQDPASITNESFESLQQDYEQSFINPDSTHELTEISKLLAAPENEDFRQKTIDSLRELSSSLGEYLQHPTFTDTPLLINPDQFKPFRKNAGAIKRSADILLAELKAVDSGTSQPGDKRAEARIALKLISLKEAMYPAKQPRIKPRIKLEIR